MLIADSSSDSGATRILYIVVGAVISAVIGHISSRVNSYRDSKKHHLEELKRHVLEPLRAVLSAESVSTQFLVEWQSQTYNPGATTLELPVTLGPVLVEIARDISLNSVEQALLEDASLNHYPSLIVEWNKFRDSLVGHRKELKRWIETLAQEILRGSGLDAHPAKDSSGPYVMHLALAVFAYKRLMGDGFGVLRVQIDAHFAILNDGGANLAKGPVEAISHLQKTIDALIATHRHRATEIHQEIAKLKSDHARLSRQFSYAIAAKKLPKACDLVPIF